MTAPAAVPLAPRAHPSGAIGRRGSLVDRLASAPPAALSAPAVVLAGIAILAWDYAVLPPDPVDHVAYWVGLAVAYAGIVLLGTAGRAGSPRQLAALAVLGAVTWLPYLLRSPDRLLFVDELYHRDVLARILETGHAAGQPVTLFPLPGTFPGLEAATTALIGFTGLPMDAAIRVMTLLIHVAIPPVAFLAAGGVGLGRRGAFLAAVVYAANTSFPFFHAVFSYETLGILLFLSTWALVGLYRGRPTPRRVLTPGQYLLSLAPGAELASAHEVRPDRRRLTLIAVAVPFLAGVAVTHHVSSYLLGISLLVAWLAARVQRARSTRGLRDLAGLGALFAAAWFLVSMERVGPYLWNSLVARFQAIVDTLLVERSQPRPLFANADQPQLERLLAFSYPPLVLLLSALGLWVAWRHREHSVLWLPFALVGPVAWLLTTPAVITRSGELAYRAWPFLFLGVGVFVALALLEVGRRVGRWSPAAVRPVVFALAGALLFGGISIGENQSGRFPGAPTTAAGGAANTPDVVAAATWLRETAGPGNLVATDVGTAVPFATDGRQRILPWMAWYPFVVGDPARIDRFVAETGTRFLVLDRRVTTLPPRYGAYWSGPPIPAALEPGAPVPAERLAALDEAASLRRVYDGPNIVIWRVTADATAGATR